MESHRTALAIFETLSATDPTNAHFRLELANALVDVGALFGQARQIAQARSLTLRGSAILKEQAERPEATVEELSAAATALLTCEPVDLRDPSAALRYAQRAAGKTNARNPSILSTLAQALAQTGDTARAIDTAQTALKLLTPSGSGRPVSGLQRELEERLAEWGQTRNEPNGRSSRTR